MSELERMTAGKLYDPSTPELAKIRQKAHQLCIDFNKTDEDEISKREEILKSLLGTFGEDTWMEPTIRFDYGINTHVGKNFYANFGLTVLDICPVKIGDDVLIGPNCNLMTALHSLIPEERRIKTRPDGSKYDIEYGKPITIQDKVWLGANVTVVGGVTIGEGSVIGAGSVVTRDIPAGVLAAGVPCRVIREITQEDSVENNPELR